MRFNAVKLLYLILKTNLSIKKTTLNINKTMIY